MFIPGAMGTTGVAGSVEPKGARLTKVEGDAGILSEASEAVVTAAVGASQKGGRDYEMQKSAYSSVPSSKRSNGGLSGALAQASSKISFLGL